MTDTTYRGEKPFIPGFPIPKMPVGRPVIIASVNWKGEGVCRRIGRFHAGLCILLVLLFLSMPLSVCAEGNMAVRGGDTDMPQAGENVSDKKSVWQDGVGEGFRHGTKIFGTSAGLNYGVLAFGGTEKHNLALSSISYGMIVGGVQGAGRWYQGNWEIRGELFGGAQFNADTRWLVGLAPHLRYNFSFGTRFVPYIDFGGGIMLQEIRAPDLGGTFQFNLQGVVGTNYFFRDDMAISLEGRYIHISSASTSQPNYGVNTVGAFLGINLFF